ncbi:MAG: thioesterase family protein [Oceanococcus sp.]
MSDSFYTSAGDHFLATAHSRGPWHSDYQHGGPPAALIARGVEQVSDGMHVARIHIDLLKPVPIAELSLSIQESTGGKRRRILQAQVHDVASGQCVAQANALLLRKERIELGGLPEHPPKTPISPSASHDCGFEFFRDAVSYETAMHMKRSTPSPTPGRGQMWMKPKIALLDEEPASALQRIFLACDSGSGVSMALDPRRYSFLNTDLNVSIRRYPQGEWVCLDARTHFQDFGLGLCETLIWDEHGVVATATQNLLLQELSDA